MPTPRIGLVLGGGGARGAFTAGVVHYLQAVERIRRYPVVSGTSTGALVGALACTGQFALLKKLYTTVQAGDIVNPHLGTL
ncbi:MAG TPA: patatin-like phospholipase family protein, partial [Planctomycetota bacterium]|nr:patatin-like phospholipase family protein [Planctomycetota bacterium]